MTASRLPLGPKEYQLLLILIERPGKVFSRAPIIGFGMGAWCLCRRTHRGRAFKPSSESLDYTNDGILPNLIRTVRGSGYALQKIKS